MRRMAGWGLLAAALCSGAVWGQEATRTPRLELAVEPATTSVSGTPTTLRITVTNTGADAVRMPVLREYCSPDGWIHVVESWTTDGGGYAVSGGSCDGEQNHVLDRARREWVSLRPGESMVQTVSLRVVWAPRISGIRYHVEYVPPLLTAKQRAELAAAGYLVPTEKLVSREESYPVDGDD